MSFGFAFVRSRRSGLARAGFTLIELLVVLGVVAVLLALTLPAVQKVRAAAGAARCSSNLRQLALACHVCQDAHGRMPPAWDWFPGLNTTGGSAGIGPLFFHLLPFIEQENLYKTSRFTAASPPQDYFDFGHNKELQQRQLPLYNCPLDPTLPGQAGAPGVAPIAGSSYEGGEGLG